MPTPTNNLITPNGWSSRSLELGALVLLCFTLHSAHAQVVVAGCDETSLNDAISLAQSLGSNVVFNSDCSITLSEPVDIATNTTIDASGFNVSISGGGSTNNAGVTVFYVEPGVSNLTLIGLTITGGQNTNGGGGLYINPNSTVVLSNCTLNANTATLGGGLYISTNATALLSNCTLSANSAIGTNGIAGTNGNNGGDYGSRGTDGTSGAVGLGGAIYNLGQLNIQQCLFSGNLALGGAGGSGGNGGNGNISGGNGGNGANGASAFGGAICNLGTLLVKDSTFSANSVAGGAGGAGGTNGSGPFASYQGDGGGGSPGYGAGIYSPGKSTVLTCTFSTNVAMGGNSAVAGTSPSSGNGLNGKTGGAALGGGLCSLGTNILVNCTFAGNSASGGNGGNGGPNGYGGGPSGNGGDGGTGSGGGFYSGSMTHVTNCTFCFCGAFGGNGGTNGGGAFSGSDGAAGFSRGGDVASGGGSFTLKNSIIATNLSGGNAYGSIIDAGHNLSSDASISFTSGSSTNNIDAKLGPLADNTGPTKTMALQRGSPAIDAAGTNFADFPATDQRGVSRRPPPGTACDIGAYEVSPPSIQSIITQPPSLITTNGVIIVGQTNGGTVSFTAQVVGELPLRFRWRLFGTNIPGPASTNSTYTLSNVTISNAGNYTVFVTNSYGAITSSIVALGLAPFITTEPSDQTVSPSGIATFAITATGSTNLAYQWYLSNFNGTNPVAGATATNLMIGAPQQTNSGGYFVIVTNAFGSATSSVAMLTVTAPPYIFLQPSSMIVTQGSDVTFSVLAQGATEFQWRTNFVNVPNASGSNFFIANVSSNLSGLNFDVIVTNDSGAVTSTVATLTVVSGPNPPTISTQPASQSVPLDSSATFSVVAAGFPPLRYQWYFNLTNPIAGATNSNLTLMDVHTNDAGKYHVVVTNAFGSITSSQATLVVLPPSAPLITAQPTNQAVLQGASATFSVTAIGTQPLAYQWFFNGTNLISGATNTTYTLNNAQAANAGLYSVLITNSFGSTNSSQAALSVNTAPFIINQSSNTTASAGSSVTFFVTAGGTPPFAYQWSQNGNPIPGATNSTYTINPVRTNDAGDYYVSVQNGFGSPVFSDDIILTVLSSPVIVTQPAGTNYSAVGGVANFSVVAVGSGTLAYQWRFNGIDRLGATNASYTISNVQSNDAGAYKVVVTNLAGSITSAPALLSVGLAPSVVTNPLNQTIGVGCSATFSAVFAGATPLSYQWQFMATNLPTATNSVFTLNNAQTANAGTYAAIVTNTFGAATSAPAMLTIGNVGYTISGRVLNGSGGLSGVTITAVGTNANYTATTDANGYYTLTDLPPGTYNVTASLSGYHFSGPLSETVPSCVTGADFMVVAQTYTLGGKVTGNGAGGLASVSVRLVGAQSGTFPTTTDNTGAYSVSGLPPDIYTVTATKTGFAFSPDTSIVNLPPDTTNVNFLAGPYIISIVHLTNGQVRLALFGPVDSQTHIQASTNLSTNLAVWINVFTNKTSNQYLDTTAPNFPQRFYRAVR